MTYVITWDPEILIYGQAKNYLNHYRKIKGKDPGNVPGWIPSVNYNTRKTKQDKPNSKQTNKAKKYLMPFTLTFLKPPFFFPDFLVNNSLNFRQYGKNQSAFNSLN